MGDQDIALWGGFTVAVAVLLFLDLAVLNRKSHVLSLKEALGWSAGWISLALSFGLVILFREGTGPALEYYTGYIIEYSLSVDNLFVFILIFEYFAVPAELKPRVLKWGILGAVVMRGVMILVGAWLLNRFEWIIYPFGAIVLLTGFKMMRSDSIRIEPERNPVVRLARRFLPCSLAYEGQAFFVRSLAGWKATPLFLVLLVVESTDVVFAVDSIPAIFAVTRDPFIVYSSNVFAILGLRSLFFVLASMIDKFEYLKPGVAAILVFVGLKMLASHYIHVPIALSLGLILATLTLAVLLSIVRSRSRLPPPGDAPPRDPPVSC